ncbi:MAG: GNAT family N-acetyltransferase [Saprospiraceae bacterium]
MIIFETTRLKVRPLTDSDFNSVYRLLSDPETMRYIRAPFTEEQQARDRMALWADYAEKCPGLGTFVMEMKDSGVFAGFCVARQVGYDPSSQEYEIGYILAPEYRGKGLASELVPPLNQYCFGQSPAQHLVAFTHPENVVSQRVLIKSGFNYIGLRETSDGTSAEFWLERNAL